MEYCSKCGKQLPDPSWKYCPWCGQQIPNRGSTGCYLTTACMQEYAENFKDGCYELETLRRFRDTYVEGNHPDDVQYYYKVAPQLVQTIDSLPERREIYIEIYEKMMVPVIKLIELKKHPEAYNLYKSYSLKLERKYLN